HYLDLTSRTIQDGAGLRSSAVVPVQPGQLVLREMNEADAVPFAGFVGCADLGEGGPGIGVGRAGGKAGVGAEWGFGPPAVATFIAPEDPLVMVAQFCGNLLEDYVQRLWGAGDVTMAVRGCGGKLDFRS